MLKKMNEKKIYSDAWLEFFQDEVQFPDGSMGTYAWAQRKNGVAVVVLTTEQTILLHNEYRYVISGLSWEVQGGGIDANETAEQAGVREVFEESGITITESQLNKLGTFYPLHSLTTEQVALFAVVIEPTAVTTQGTETSEEIIEQRFVPFAEALDMIDTGKVNDAFTAHAIQLAIRRYESLKSTITVRK
jgi:ADP-ribose pyrophosphatase